MGDDAAARYESIDAEAAIVRMVDQSNVDAGMSIGAITRMHVVRSDAWLMGFPLAKTRRSAFAKLLG